MEGKEEKITLSILGNPSLNESIIQQYVRSNSQDLRKLI